MYQGKHCIHVSHVIPVTHQQFVWLVVMNAMMDMTWLNFTLKGYLINKRKIREYIIVSYYAKVLQKLLSEKHFKYKCTLDFVLIWFLFK